MKRKSIVIIVVMIAVLALCLTIYVKNSNINKYARQLPFEVDSQVMAIFFLGGLEEAYDYSLVNKYYAKADIESFENIDLGGEEYYLVVPRYKVDILVSSLTMTEDGGTEAKPQQELNAPFFLKCNASDIFSNSEISFEYNNKEYKYSPYISLKDGSVVTEKFVLLVEQ